TYHALVVAGLHVGALAWFFLLLLRIVRIPAGWGWLATLVFLAGFVLLCGSRLPTVRATCLVGAYMLCRLLYRQRRALNIIAATALGMLVVDPGDLFDVSFQLSFLSVAVIAAVAVPIIEQTLEPYRLALVDLPNRDRDMHLPPKVAQTRIEWRMAAGRLPFAPRVSMAIVCGAIRPLVAAGELIIVSASVQLGLALPMAVYFHRISWSGLSANLLVVPLIGLIVPLGFVAILTGWGMLGKAVSALVTAMIAVAEWHARLSWLEARVPLPPVWLGIAFAGALAFFAWSFGKRRIFQAAAVWVLFASVAGLVLHPFAPRLEPGKLEITALDVGQGEALFLALPQGQAMLVDGGGLATFGNVTTRLPDIGEEVVSPYLWSRSVRSLDVVAVSHAHYDHVGGLPAVLENFRVRELWIGNNPSTPDYERVLETARRRGTQVVRLTRGDARSVGGVTLADDGLLPHADVLKVPHHGSKTSSNDFFLAQTTPWFALISAGYDNPYGHPHPDVLSRLSERRAYVLRTDRDGQVTVSTDGHRLFLETYEWNRR
ncbi:MAG: ComEC/Rec2 family competence protein, partial [Acidobacteria bacterium]|nr:ComEC/Rec2 family competence protein [Acidobacteriota bacterium]